MFFVSLSELTSELNDLSSDIKKYDDTTMKDRLKSIRELLNKTQSQMASLIDISPRAWQSYEMGKSVPGGKVLLSLAGLGFNVNWILTGEGPMRIDEHRRHTREDMVSGVSLGDKGALQSDNLGLGESVELLAKIYNSGDQVLIRAIAANLQAFGAAINDRHRADQAIKLMGGMEERITALEKRLETEKEEPKRAATGG